MQEHSMNKGWVGIDLDGTLAHYEPGQFPKIGEPIPAMMAQMFRLIDAGYEVRIFTARACEPNQIPIIQEWLKKMGLPDLKITCSKDFDMLELWDDRAVAVESNTGRHLCFRRL